MGKELAQELQEILIKSKTLVLVLVLGGWWSIFKTLIILDILITYFNKDAWNYEDKIILQ